MADVLIMAKKNNLTYDDNIHNTHHEKRQELPMSRLKQTWQDEAANAAMDAYDNYRDRKADERQQNRRIRDYQRERVENGRNSEQIHLQRRGTQARQNPAPGVIIPSSAPQSKELENIPMVDQVESETTSFNHEVNAVINPRASIDPVNVLAPIEAAYKHSDLYQGYKTIKIVTNTFQGSGKHRAEKVLKAYGFERNKKVDIKTDINNKLALNERSLNMTAVNVANLNVSKIDTILSHGQFKGQKLTDTQINLLRERRDLLSAKSELQRKGYNLSDMLVDQSVRQSDMYRGAKAVSTAGRIGAKATNVLISAPTSAASSISYGAARITGNQNFEKAGDTLGDFSASSLTGKIKMAGSGTIHVVGKGASITGHAIGHAASQSIVGQTVANGVVRARVVVNDARVRVVNVANDGKARIVGTVNNGKAKIVNSKAGQIVGAGRARVANVTGRVRNSKLGQATIRVGDGVGKVASHIGGGARKLSGRVSAVRQKRIIKKNKRKQLINKIFGKIKMGAIAAVAVVCLLTLIVSVAGGVVGVIISSVQGSSTSSSTNTDEPSLMQQAVANMYSTQVAIEDDIRDGTGGTTGISPATVTVKLNGSTVEGGLSKIGLESIMDGVANMTTDNLNISYRGKTERIKDTVETYYTYTANESKSIKVKVKDRKVSYYQDKKPENMDTEKNKNKKIKIYYLDLCDENNADLMIYYRKPVVDDTTKNQEDAAKYSEPLFLSTEYFEVKAKDLDDLADKRWDLEVSGGIQKDGPFERHHYTPAGEYTNQVAYGPAASTGKTGGSYGIPEVKSDGKFHISADSESPDPEITMKVMDSEGNISSINQLYKAICCIASAGTGNTSTDSAYFNDWCTYLFNKVISSGDVTVNVQTSPDANKTFCWYGYLEGDVIPCNGSDVEGAGASKFKNMSKGDRYLYTAQAVKMDVSVEYVVHFDFESLLSEGDNITYKWQLEHTTDCPWKKNTWKGFHDDDGTLNDIGCNAKAWFEMDDSAFEDLGVIFPGNTYPILSDSKIEAYLAQITQNCGGTLSQTRTDVIRAALQYVGRFTYCYAGGHGSYESREIAAEVVGKSGGVDCSGFVSFIMNQGGVLMTYSVDGYTAMGASSFAGYGSATSKGALKPGDIVVKNSEAGGSATSSNHVVIYAGKFDTGDGAGVIDRFIECTTTNNTVDGQEIQQCSGSQISKASRSNYIFGKYQYYRNPYGD